MKTFRYPIWSSLTKTFTVFCLAVFLQGISVFTLAATHCNRALEHLSQISTEDEAQNIRKELAQITIQESTLFTSPIFKKILLNQISDVRNFTVKTQAPNEVTTDSAVNLKTELETEKRAAPVAHEGRSDISPTDRSALLWLMHSVETQNNARAQNYWDSLISSGFNETDIKRYAGVSRPPLNPTYRFRERTYDFIMTSTPESLKLKNEDNKKTPRVFGIYRPKTKFADTAVITKAKPETATVDDLAGLPFPLRERMAEIAWQHLVSWAREPFKNKENGSLTASEDLNLAQANLVLEYAANSKYTYDDFIAIFKLTQAIDEQPLLRQAAIKIIETNLNHIYTEKDLGTASSKKKMIRASSRNDSPISHHRIEIKDFNLETQVVQFQSRHLLEKENLLNTETTSLRTLLTTQTGILFSRAYFVILHRALTESITFNGAKKIALMDAIKSYPPKALEELSVKIWSSLKSNYSVSDLETYSVLDLNKTSRALGIDLDTYLKRGFLIQAIETNSDMKYSVLKIIKDSLVPSAEILGQKFDALFQESKTPEPSKGKPRYPKLRWLTSPIKMLREKNEADTSKQIGDRTFSLHGENEHEE